MIEGEVWREAREKKGLSQGEVAKKLGIVTSQYVSNVERGLCNMARKHYPKLAKIFGPKVVNDVIDIRTDSLKESLRNAL